MDRLALSGRSILVVEEEPLVALQLEEQLHRAGAKVLAARKLHEALRNWPEVPVVSKPADSRVVVNSVAQLLS